MSNATAIRQLNGPLPDLFFWRLAIVDDNVFMVALPNGFLDGTQQLAVGQQNSVREAGEDDKASLLGNSLKQKVRLVRRSGHLLDVRTVPAQALNKKLLESMVGKRLLNGRHLLLRQCRLDVFFAAPQCSRSARSLACDRFG